MVLGKLSGDFERGKYFIFFRQVTFFGKLRGGLGKLRRGFRQVGGGFRQVNWGFMQIKVSVG